MAEQLIFLNETVCYCNLDKYIAKNLIKICYHIEIQ